MQTITTIGLDIAKSVFQVHGVDAGGQVVVRRQLKRRSVLAFFQTLSPCLVGIEACASSHHWSRELQALGHTVRCPGAGPMLATALVASVADPRTSRSGRNFSAWIGLVPKQHSSGGKERLGSISKQGDRYLRSLFVAGALAVIRSNSRVGVGIKRQILFTSRFKPPRLTPAIAGSTPRHSPLREESRRCARRCRAHAAAGPFCCRRPRSGC